MLSRSELSDTIIKKARSLGASIAGIASVESLKRSPSHTIYPQIGMNLNESFDDTNDALSIVDVFWPADAVSAVVIGIEHNADKPELDWWDGKETTGNRLLMTVNKKLSEWIENSFPVKTYKLPYSIEGGGIFLKDAAVNAGLGCIGKNNLVITPEYGPRIRFRALLLDREAEPTGPSEFRPCENCGEFCRKACPVKAFQNNVYSVKAMGQSLLPGINGTYDRVSCNLQMEKDIDEAAQAITAHDKNQNNVRELIYEFEKSHTKEPDGDQPFNYCVKYCRKCELSCPIGAD